MSDANIYLYHNDCLNIMKMMEDKSVDFTFTSPPYNRKRNDKYHYYEDKKEDYYDFLCKITNEMLRITKDFVIINLQKNYYNKKDIFKYIGNYYDDIVEIIVWGKNNPMPASGFNITNAYEFFIILGKKSLKSNHTYTKNLLMTNVNKNNFKEHKAVMKQDVADWFINNFTTENQTILDPFMGLGTTGISCKKMNRKFIGIEIEREYYEIAKERIFGREYE